jgi:hypothetical protein
VIRIQNQLDLTKHIAISDWKLKINTSGAVNIQCAESEPSRGTKSVIRHKRIGHGDKFDPGEKAGKFKAETSLEAPTVQDRGWV